MVDPVETLVQAAADAQPVILVVEDNFLLRWPVCEFLRDSGYRVVEAASVQEAIAVFSSNVPVDMVFSDVDLQGELKGNALSSWLREHHPDMPMLMTSGDRSACESVLTTPTRLFIAKPYALAEVDQLIRSALARND
jgi:DNA-binding NtrC family response regulator